MQGNMQVWVIVSDFRAKQADIKQLIIEIIT